MRALRGGRWRAATLTRATRPAGFISKHGFGAGTDGGFTLTTLLAPNPFSEMKPAGLLEWRLFYYNKQTQKSTIDLHHTCITAQRSAAAGSSRSRAAPQAVVRRAVLPAKPPPPPPAVRAHCERRSAHLRPRILRRPGRAEHPHAAVFGGYILGQASLARSGRGPGSGGIPSRGEPGRSAI
jgi:hypothetical protein